MKPFGHTGAGNKLAKEYRVLHLDEIVIPRTDHPKQCWEFGGEQRPSRVLGFTDFGLGAFLCLVSSWCFLFCRSSLFRALGVFCVFFGFSFFVVFGLTYFCDGGRKPSCAYLELEIAMST